MERIILDRDGKTVTIEISVNSVELTCGDKKVKMGVTSLDLIIERAKTMIK